MKPSPLPLTTAPLPERERADARRNRERILCAAARLVDEHGIDGVSMDDVAAAAGVGKGTLYRRFGDRWTLLRALIDEPERDFQDELIRGEPPLGPARRRRSGWRLRRRTAGAAENHAVHVAGDKILGPPRCRSHLLPRPPGLSLREILGDDARTDCLWTLLAALAPDLFLTSARSAACRSRT